MIKKNTPDPKKLIEYYNFINYNLITLVGEIINSNKALYNNILKFQLTPSI